MESFNSSSFPSSQYYLRTLFQLETFVPPGNVSQTESSVSTVAMKTSFQEKDAHQTRLLSHSQQKHR